MAIYINTIISTTNMRTSFHFDINKAAQQKMIDVINDIGFHDLMI